ncbi:hypothetical protein [Luethyella okanaganae]|uniref:DNA polymerase III subunit gamma/tau n=1 Tax=Luethyella okanaganae TaxID=69372 RepID=A0ABW1VB25_9MICO
MTRHSDDDALSWPGEDDPTLLGKRHAAEGDLAPGWTVVGQPATDAGNDAGNDAVDEPAVEEYAASSTVLILLGVLGGIYLLYTVGWAVAAGRVVNGASDVVGGFMFTLGLWFAIVAPTLWFGVTFWLTLGRPRLRLLWLLVGVVVLVPLPFIAGVGAGA